MKIGLSIVGFNFNFIVVFERGGGLVFVLGGCLGLLEIFLSLSIGGECFGLLIVGLGVRYLFLGRVVGCLIFLEPFFVV